MNYRQREIRPETQIQQILERHSQAREIIIFAPSLPWEGEMFQRPQQLAHALSRQGALVFYMQPERSWPAKFQEIEKRLILCSTPADAFRIVPEAYIYTLTWSIPLLAFFDSPRVIYDYLDDLSVFQGDHKRMQRDHDDTLQSADLVLVTSRELYGKAVILREDSLLCPNGADFDHFHLQEEKSTPPDLEPILDFGKPIIGYHGALARWFDYQLVKGIAQQRTDLHFVLIGIDHDQTLQNSGMLDLPNIHWLGRKPYQDLPDYLRFFDAGMIPFQVNEITDATSPIKLFEYFAAGIPTVVTPMAESKRYDHVLTAQGVEEWSQMLDQALSLSQDPEFKRKLFQLGKSHSWESRADKILEKLHTLESAPSKRPWYLSEKITHPTLQRTFRLLGRVIKVFRTTGIRGVLQGTYYKLYDQLARIRRRQLFHLPRKWQETYYPEDNSQVVLYTKDSSIFPDYQPRIELKNDLNISALDVSIISPMLNESDNIEKWLDHLRMQSKQPSEVIVVDTGSSDGSPEMIEGLQDQMPFPVKLIRLPGVNIAQARNTAIRQASHQLITTLDFGCFPHQDWLENLLLPFLQDKRVEMSAGWFYPQTPQGKISYPGRWPKLADINPQDYVPASRALAFTKAAWEKVGGYPEWLTLTGEDTYFALELKRFCKHWAFVPSAVVEWLAPGSWVSFLKKSYYWSTGDGESGITAKLYWLSLKRLVIFLISGLLSVSLLISAYRQLQLTSFWLSGVSAMVGLTILGFGIKDYLKDGLPLWQIPAELSYRTAQVAGFLAGARKKAEVDQHRLQETKGLFLILAGVPIDDTGGGARCTQIALELLRQNYWVVYINRYPKWETQDAGVRIAHPNLYTYALSEFYWDDFEEQYGSLLRSRSITALVELPHADFLPMINKIEGEGGTIVYEMIDDWDSALGGEWYSREIEREIIRLSEGLIGTAPSLKERLEEISGRSALFLPNAVNSRLFNPEKTYQRPADLPEAAWVAMYIGALWGEWFDWDLLVGVARRYPEAAVVVIGDYRGQCPDPQPNLHFLGLKPQTALPGYLAGADVALIPWEVSPITQATSPLKLYEYLATHTPVVAPELNPLRGIPGVRLAKSTEEFIDIVLEVAEGSFPTAEVEAFIQENNWQARVRELIAFMKDLQSANT